MIVTDTNVIVYLALGNERSELAEAAFEKDPIWVAPLLWRSEICQALAKYVQFAGMSLDDAILALHTAEEFVDPAEYKVSTEKVLRLAARTRCTAYDCEFVVLATDLAVPLVTTDKQLLQAFPKIAVSLEKFAKRHG